MHSEGINLRYLGVVLSLIPIDEEVMSFAVRSFIMCEILARVIKNEINALLRDSMSCWKIPMEARYRSAVVEYLNFVLVEDSPKSTAYWDGCLKPLAQRFFHVQRPYTEPYFPLKEFVLHGVRKKGTKTSEGGGKYGTKVTEYFILRIAALAAVRLSPLVVDKVFRQQPLNLWDLEGFSEQVKHMNIIADATGNNFAYHGLLELKETGDYESAGFYFRQAIVKYRMALQSNPNNPQLLEHLAICLASESIVSCVLESDQPPPQFRSGHWPEVTLKQGTQSVQDADQVFLRAFDADPENDTLLGLYAEYLVLCGRFDRAENYYLRALARNLDPEILRTYIELVSESGQARYAYLLYLMLYRLLARKEEIERERGEEGIEEEGE
uniref:CLU central domain-containing protein n=1 Tax=Paramoeba aestuarina TaxID=180227 RepID=A0A7S4K9F7_9EUKA